MYAIRSYYAEIVVLNSDLNNEYSSNNDRLKGEITKLNFTSHEKAISEMYKYFKGAISYIPPASSKRYAKDAQLSLLPLFIRNNFV